MKRCCRAFLIALIITTFSFIILLCICHKAYLESIGESSPVYSIIGQSLILFIDSISYFYNLVSSLTMIQYFDCAWISDKVFIATDSIIFYSLVWSMYLFLYYYIILSSVYIIKNKKIRNIIAISVIFIFPIISILIKEYIIKRGQGLMNIFMLIVIYSVLFAFLYIFIFPAKNHE